ncbi:MAG: cytoplasmic protein [Sphingomonas sp.]|jgi:hypothetical protein|uniref:cytoplasmic protein n=1 Tax=Sphingomonas sp. TaxID=28214 RepID=UPI003562B9A2
MAEAESALARLKAAGGPAIEAHSHCTNNRAELEQSEVAGCFYCCETFSPKSIDRWLKEGDGTAFCPQCSIDSVIGDASGYPAGDPEFLKEMNKVWF